MSKITVILLAFSVSCSAFAAGTNDTKKATRKRLTPEERVALHERARLRLTGGMVREPGSARGMFVILNNQKLLPEQQIKDVIRALDEKLEIKASLKTGEELTPANIFDKITQAGGTVGVGLIEDATLPSLLVAPESRWALINVAKLNVKCPDKDVLSSRLRKEIFRSLAFTTGCAYSTMMDPLMRDVLKPSDLDGLRGDEFGLEIMNKFISSAPLYSLKPWHSTTYRKACEEGWAPQPTNDIQKAVWDKVHQLPTEPIKIKPETKKVTE